MRCNASQTTFTAADPERVRALAAQFEGLLFAQVLQPMSASLGKLGDVLASRVGESLAERSQGGVTQAIVEALQREGALT